MSAEPDAASQPDRIGPYRILETLGEGGMGIVYLAEQTHPIRRRVALKLIKLGIALGATFGWMVAGPSGAVFGGILGVFLFGAAMGG